MHGKTVEVRRTDDLRDELYALYECLVHVKTVEVRRTDDLKEELYALYIYIYNI